MPKRIKTITTGPKRKQRRRPKSRSRSHKDPFYSSNAWRKLRAWFMSRPENAWCAHCLWSGTRRPAVVCDHIEPRQTCRARELDPTNLQALCRHCDAKKTAADVKAGKAGRSTRVNPNGPVDSVRLRSLG